MLGGGLPVAEPVIRSAIWMAVISAEFPPLAIARHPPRLGGPDATARCLICQETREGGSMNLNSILIGTEDPQRLVGYYTKLFGDPGWDDGGFTGWQIGSGGITVGLHDQVKGKNAQPGRLIWNIETSDVKGDFERLKAAGATVVREPYHLGESGGPEAWIATFADPDDNYFQLISPMQP
jgi:predicted enzyme related to lactoylglutathione lyase